MKKVIKIGVIGYGYWGPNVLRVFNEDDKSEVVACCDLKKDKLEIVRKRYPKTKITSNTEYILKNKEIDAVAIATPLSSHYSLALKALKAKKHVWIEKPMTENSQQSKELLKLAKKNKKIIFVDHIFLYTKAITYLKKFVDSGKLGRIYYLDSTRINLGIFQPDNNVIWDLATHDISIMCHILGKTPKTVSAYGTSHLKSKFEDMAYLNLTFDRHTLAHISVSWLSPVKIRRTLVAGSKKMVTYDDLEASEKIKIYDYGVSIDKSYRPQSSTTGHQYRTGDIHSPALESKEALQIAADHFINCIISNKEPLTNGESGYKVVKILEAASSSLKKGGRVENINI
jgi:predicted dehydrogenase